MLEMPKVKVALTKRHKRSRTSMEATSNSISNLRRYNILYIKKVDIWGGTVYIYI